MPKSYTYLCEQEAHDASEHGAEHSLPCFGWFGLLVILPCYQLSQAVVYVFELPIDTRVALYLLANINNSLTKLITWQDNQQMCIRDSGNTGGQRAFCLAAGFR